MTKSAIILIRNAASTDFGGGERVPVFIAREAQKDKLNLIIFSRSEKLLDFARVNGVTTRKTWWWPRQDWSGKRALLFPIYCFWQLTLFIYYSVLFLKYRARVVHVQSKDDFIAATFAARLCSAKVIWSDYADLKHIFMNHRVWYKNPVGKFVYFAAHFTQKILVVSKEDLRLISENIPKGTISNKMKIVYNGAFDSYKPVKKFPIFTFISTGRLVTDKGIGELIDAFKRLNKKYQNTQLYLLGDGPERQAFETRARDNKSIRFLGYQQEPLNYVAQSHVFLLPTYHEGFSLALVEACMLRMPIIATDIGGNPEIIRDNDTGVLIPIKNTYKLYKTMQTLYDDEDLRDTLAKSARNEYVKKFNFEKIINDEFITFYRKSL